MVSSRSIEPYRPISSSPIWAMSSTDPSADALKRPASISSRIVGAPKISTPSWRSWDIRRMTASCGAPLEALQSAPEIGPVVAASVRSFADEPHNRALIEKLAAAGVNMASQQP